MEIQNEREKEFFPLKKRNIKDRISEFFEKHRGMECLISCAFIVIFISLIFVIFLKVYGIYPFGKDCLSSYDLLAQVAPFMEHFFDVINGKSSLFYSFSIAGGADVFGTLAYCTLSPFTFIYLLFGSGNIYYGTSVVLPLKIICIALSGYFYLKKRFDNIPPHIKVALALSYGFCGYMFVANTYISWLDLLIYLPWVVYGFFVLIKENKKWIMVLSMCLMIYTCFSISSFSCFLIFPIMIIYCLYIFKGQERKEKILNVVLSFVSIVMFSLPILLPALSAYMVSGRKTGLFENLLNRYSEKAVYEKTTYLLTDAIVLFITVLYFVKNGFKRPIDRFLFVSLLILLVPVFFDESCNLLNFGSYMGYSLRFGFLNGFYFFFVASLLISEGQYEKSILKKSAIYKASCNEKTVDENVDSFKKDQPVNKKKSVYAIITWATLLIGVVAMFFLSYGISKNAFGKYFSSRLAHALGGLEVTAIMFGIIAFVLSIGVSFVKFKKISSGLLSVIVAILALFNATFYSQQLVIGNKKAVESFEELGIITDYIKDLEKNDYERVKLEGDYVTACFPFTLHTNAVSVFSSVVDGRNFSAPNFFECDGNGKNSAKTYYVTYYPRYYNQNPLADSVMGNKYIISDGFLTSEFAEKIVDVGCFKDENGNALNTGEYSLYKNKYVFPHAYMVDNAKTSLDENTLAGKYDSLLKLLGGSDYSVEFLDDSDIEISTRIQNKEKIFHVNCVLPKRGNCFVMCNFENNEDVLLCNSTDGTKSLEKKHEFSIEGRRNCDFYIKSANSEKPLTEEEIRKSCKAFYVAENDVKSLYKKITEDENKRAEFSLSPGKIHVKINGEKGKYLFLNYVSLKGHTCYVNGQERKFEDNFLNYMLVPLDDGENTVEIVYRSPYPKYILAGILTAILYGICYLFVFIKAKKPAKILCTPVYYMALCLSGGILIFFFAMPVLVCIVNNIILFLKYLLTL